MSNRIGPIGCVCFISLFAAPIISGFIKGETLTKSSSNGIYRGQNVEVEVLDVGVSNNGFKYCTFYVKSIERKMIGPCTDTDTNNKMAFTIGAKYLVTKLQITNNNIVINEAQQISSGSKVKVVRLFTKARTVLAELENGDVVGGTNLNVGDYVYR